MKKSWEVKKLGEVSKINYGYTEKASFQDIGPKFLRITDIQENKVDWETVPFCNIAKPDLAKYQLFEGDIVFARTGATTGKSLLIKNPPLSIFASYLIKLQINNFNQLKPEFLFLFFQTKNYWDKIEIGLSGSAQGGFNATKLAELQIPLPSIPEQQRIVVILDGAFKAVATAKETAEKNLQNANELFESYLEGVFANPGDGWEEKKLGEICDFTRGPFGGSLKKMVFRNNGYAVYEQMHAIHNQFNRIRYFIDEAKFKEMKRFELKPGDIIMSCSGATLGRVAIAPENIEQGIINQALLKLTPTKRISIIFLKSWMQSNNFQGRLKTYSKGAAIPNIKSVKILKEIEVPVPPLPEQRTIVAKLDALSAETDELKAVYENKLADLEVTLPLY